VSDQFPNAAILAPQDFTACGKTRSGGRPGIYPRHKSFRINGALQAAEKPFPTGKKCQGTTSVVPQVQQNKRWASAPEGCSAGFRTANRPFPAASLALEVCFSCFRTANLTFPATWLDVVSQEFAVFGRDHWPQVEPPRRKQRRFTYPRAPEQTRKQALDRGQSWTLDSPRKFKENNHAIL
jgi:hypothetical protein